MHVEYVKTRSCRQPSGCLLYTTVKRSLQAISTSITTDEINLTLVFQLQNTIYMTVQRTEESYSVLLVEEL